MEFLIGGLSGAGATLFTNPMDVIKTRLQLQGELQKHGEHVPHYRGMFHGLYVVGKTDGLLALQKGLPAAVMFGFNMNFFRLGLYKKAEEYNYMKNKNGEYSVYRALPWAWGTGFIGGITSNPALMVKTRLQSAAHQSIAVGDQHKYTGTWDAIKTIYKSQGAAGFFTGLNANCFRVAVGSAAQLTTFSTVKEELKVHGICKESPTLLAVLASMVSGLNVALAMCPLDVVTTRLYNQARHPEEGLKYNGVIDCLMKTYKVEGFYGLYKGVGPLYLRAGPHSILTLVFWDRLNFLFVKENIK